MERTEGRMERREGRRERGRMERREGGKEKEREGGQGYIHTYIHVSRDTFKHTYVHT